MDLDHAVGEVARSHPLDPWARVAEAVQALELTDLRPSPTVNVLFGQLVDAALALPACHPQIARHGPRVRHLCARGEGYLETWWAHRVIAYPETLPSFPYLTQYEQLVRGEWTALTGALGRRPRHVALVGSGPLPLTAVWWRRLAPDVQVTCIDRDPGAVGLGRRVAWSVAGRAGAPAFVHAEAGEVDSSAFDAVVLAALVGDAAGKTAAVDALASRMRDDGVLAVRSVPPDGRRLLYPRVRPEDLPSSVRLVAEWTPPPEVINSVLLLAPRAAGPDRR